MATFWATFGNSWPLGAVVVAQLVERLLLSIVLNKLYRKDENKEKGPRMAQFKNWATSGHTGAFDPAKGGCLEID